MVVQGWGMINKRGSRQVRWWRPGKMRWMKNEAMQGLGKRWDMRGVTEVEEERSDDRVRPLTSWLKVREGAKDRDRQRVRTREMRWKREEKPTRRQSRPRRGREIQWHEWRNEMDRGWRNEGANESMGTREWKIKRVSRCVCGPGRARPFVIQPGC